MRKRSICYGIAVAIATLLIVGLTFAQSPNAANTQKNNHARETSSGMPTGRRQYDPTLQTINSRNSAHATESMSAHQTSGTNPLYNPKEYTLPKDRAIKPNSGSNNTTEFKQDFGQVQAKKDTIASPNGQSSQGSGSGSSASAAREKTYRPGRQKAGDISVTR